MLTKVVVLLMMFAIFASLASAAVFLLRQRDHSRKANMARALTWRIGLSIALFMLLIAGFYLGIISPHGVAPR